MGYIEANLLADETVIYKARLHWVIFVKSLTLIFLGLVFMLIQPIVAGVVVLIGIAALISPTVNYLTSEFGVTNKRSSKLALSGAEPWNCCCATSKRSPSI